MKVCYNSWNSHHYHNVASFLKLTTIYNIINGPLMALYIFPPVTLYKIISPIPVVMALLIILDHLLVLTICIHHLPIHYLFVE